MGIDAIPLRTQPDRRLVRLVREGYESAFEEIVRRYRRPLDRFAASIVGGRSEDVTQDSFRKALVALREDGGEIELRPWLYRIVRNTALNDLRDRPPAAAELAEELLAGGRSAAAEAEQRAEVAALTAQLRALPEKQRAALVMRELEGMGHEEIATALGISDGAARQAIARGRATMRGGLGALVPVPLLRMLASSGDAATEAAIGGGAAATGVGVLKVGLATIVVAGGIGAGVAIDHHGQDHHRSGPASTASRTRDAAARPKAEPVASTPVTPAPAPVVVDDGGDKGSGDSQQSRRDDDSGHGSDDRGGQEVEPAVTAFAAPTDADDSTPESAEKSGGRPEPSSKSGDGHGGGGPGPPRPGGGPGTSPKSGGRDSDATSGGDRSGRGGGSDDVAEVAAEAPPVETLSAESDSTSGGPGPSSSSGSPSAPSSSGDYGSSGTSGGSGTSGRDGSDDDLEILP